MKELKNLEVIRIKLAFHPIYTYGYSYIFILTSSLPISSFTHHLVTFAAYISDIITYA